VWGISAWIGHAWCERVDNPEKVHKKLPLLGNAGAGINTKRARDLSAYFLEIQSRLRRVRVACGDWSRVCGLAPTINNGLTGVFLDPPYSVNRSQKYNEDTPGLSSEVREWALARGDDPKFRIALCGYEGEHDMPGSWECVPWKAHCGYAWRGVGEGQQNRHRERIWFSPHCLNPDMQLRVVESL
jgi:DNA adenine methylase